MSLGTLLARKSCWMINEIQSRLSVARLSTMHQSVSWCKSAPQVSKGHILVVYMCGPIDCIHKRLLVDEAALEVEGVPFSAPQLTAATHLYSAVQSQRIRYITGNGAVLMLYTGYNTEYSKLVQAIQVVSGIWSRCKVHLPRTPPDRSL